MAKVDEYVADAQRRMRLSLEAEDAGDAIRAAAEVAEAHAGPDSNDEGMEMAALIRRQILEVLGS